MSGHLGSWIATDQVYCCCICTVFNLKSGWNISELPTVDRSTGKTTKHPCLCKLHPYRKKENDYSHWVSLICIRCSHLKLGCVLYTNHLDPLLQLMGKNRQLYRKANHSAIQTCPLMGTSHPLHRQGTWLALHALLLTQLMQVKKITPIVFLN